MPQTFAITLLPTTTTLTIGPDRKAYVGHTVTFAVTVTASDGVALTGTWTVWDGGSCGAGTSFGPVPLDGAKAVFQTKFPSPSRKSYVACFTPSATSGGTYAASSSAPQTYAITASKKG
ncbi:MAG: hypothetical protein IPL43_02250 [Micropruina sp.]|nr:hypothetical protein [Micropruina sp.]